MQKGDSIDFTSKQNIALQIVDTIRSKKHQLIITLTQYETIKTAEDEIERTIDLLTSLDENIDYFKEVVGQVAVFMPSNQPLYSFACFAIVPSLMAAKVYVKSPEIMNGFYEKMLKILNVKKDLKNIEYLKLTRDECLSIFTATTLDHETNKRFPDFDAVIFTGTTENADRLRKKFHPSTLFIANGSGHNPIVVTETAAVEKAIDGIMSVRTYNQGQDCAAPDSILVHRDLYDNVIERMRTEIQKLTVGSYNSPTTDIGPISRPETLPLIEGFLTANHQYLDESTDGVIRTRSTIVEPTLIAKPLANGPNFTEIFAPVFVVQQYDDDRDLALYFEDARYAANAMYITIYGKSDYIAEFLESDQGKKIHDQSTVLFDIDLHKPGVERGVAPYGGYGRGASCVSKDGIIMSGPTLPQRELFEYLVTKKPLARKVKKQQKAPNFAANSIQTEEQHWAWNLANRVIENDPERDIYVCAAGISPSGTVHFGKFRDLFTAYTVAKAIEKLGKKSRLVLYWDDFDRLSEVPDSVDPTYKQYIGTPYSKIPSPDGFYESYAEKYKQEFEASLQTLGIHPEFISQSDVYRSGAYDSLIIKSLQNRKAIAEILLSMMSVRAKVEKNIVDSEFRKEYYPIVLYSRFSGKDNTQIIDYDGDSTITYKCFDTGQTESVDIRKHHIVKLAWRVDWPMRWSADAIAFEPGGPDHATPGGSFDTATKIAHEIFNVQPPLFQKYEYVGLQGIKGKLSSASDKFTLDDILAIYSPEILRWIYANRPPSSTFSLSFGKDIFRQYDEFDRMLKDYSLRQLSPAAENTLWLSGVLGINTSLSSPPSFRRILGLGQAVQWNTKKLQELLKLQGISGYDAHLEDRVARAKMWLERYNHAEKIVVRTTFNHEYLATMTKPQIDDIQQLCNYFIGQKSYSIDDIQTALYAIPANNTINSIELKTLQKIFFKDIYNLMVGSDTGPRLSTFLWAINKKTIHSLLNIQEHQ
jgi:lysyl-tRNA synthetase class 1